MKTCITKKALCILLSALLTVSVFATCLVFSASADNADAITLKTFVGYAADDVTIFARIGDAKTIGEISNAVGKQKDYHYYSAVVCDSNGKVIKVLPRGEGADFDKTNVEVPENGFILGAHDTAAQINAFSAIKEGQYIVLDGVDLKALAAAKATATLSGASFTVTDEAPAAKVYVKEFADLNKIITTPGDSDASGWDDKVLLANDKCTESAMQAELVREVPDGKIDTVTLSLYHNAMVMIGYPEGKAVVSVSADGKTYTEVGQYDLTAAELKDTSSAAQNVKTVMTFKQVEAKYVKVTLTYGSSTAVLGNSPADGKVNWEFGCVSRFDVSAKASEPVVPVSGNLALGKSYTIDELYRQGGAEVNWAYDPNIEIAWPDEDGKSLTDGIRIDADTSGYKNPYEAPAWIGFHTATPSTAETGYAWMNVDLGDKAEIDKFILCVGAKGLGGGIYIPEKVEFLVSDDGSNWTSVGTAVIPEDSEDMQCGEAVLTLSKAVSAKYVRAQVSRESGWMFVSELEVYGTVVAGEEPSEDPSEDSSEESSEEPVVDPATPSIATPDYSAFTLSVSVPASVKAGEAFNAVITIKDLETALYGVEATLTYDKSLFTATNTSDLLGLLKAKNSESGEWESLSSVTAGKYELSYVTAEAENRITNANELTITVPFVANKDVKAANTYFVVDAVAGTDDDTERVDGTGSYAKVTTIEAGSAVQPGKPSVKDVADPAAKIVIDLDGELKAGNTVVATITLKDLKSAILGLDFTLSYDASVLAPVLSGDLLDNLTKAPFVTDPAWESLSTASNGKIDFSFVNAQDANAVKSGDDLVITVKFTVSEAVSDGYTAYVVADDVAVTNIDAERVDALGAVAELTADKNEEPSDEPSDEPSSEPSSEPSEDSSDESQTSPPTGDLGVAAIALLALVTAGGVFAVRKFR